MLFFLKGGDESTAMLLINCAGLVRDNAYKMYGNNPNAKENILVTN